LLNLTEIISEFWST